MVYLSVMVSRLIYITLSYWLAMNYRRSISYDLYIGSQINLIIMAQRLLRLRQLLTSHKLGAYVLPRTDEHQSEYLATTDERVHFISNFTGSNALALVSPHEALLWTDSRYFIQAQKQMQPQWSLRKMLGQQPKWFEHLSQKYPELKTVGFDPNLFSAKNAIDRIKYFKEKGIEFRPVLPNLVDQVWENRPEVVKPEIFLHESWAGRTIREKVSWVRERIKEKKGSAALFNDLSDIAWILNLRSSQIPHNPFFKAILVITLSGGTLHLSNNHPSLQNKQIISHLQTQNIQMVSRGIDHLPYTLINKNQLNYNLFNNLKDLNYIQWEGINLYRAIKTDKQIKGIKRCHLADGIALAKFWAWRAQQHNITEYQAAEKIDGLRREQQYNCGVSFDTISACGSNGAIVHYRPSATNSAVLDNNKIHLLDSGGQYFDGTTDVTRAFHFGTPTQEEKEAYTRVLLGNLDIERLEWPQGVLNGAQIDVLARRHLWRRRWDYQHGTGHGVGYFGAVHQPPVGISRLSEVKFQDGMIVTNEPGYYKQNCFGIRIENILLVREKERYNYFENLTLCPYDRNLIARELLDGQTIAYIDGYHRRVWEVLRLQLVGDEVALKWLGEATRPL